MTDNARKWLERVREWRASGMTAPAFASAQGYAPSTLRYWASQLRHEPAPPPRPASALRRVRLARVEVSPSHPATPIVVDVAGARIEVRAGFDRALLHDVVDVLRGGGGQ